MRERERGVGGERERERPASHGSAAAAAAPPPGSSLSSWRRGTTRAAFKLVLGRPIRVVSSARAWLTGPPAAASFPSPSGLGTGRAQAAPERQTQSDLWAGPRARPARVGTLAGPLYLIRGYGFKAREAVAWLRLVRQGGVTGAQLQYLEGRESSMCRDSVKNGFGRRYRSVGESTWTVTRGSRQPPR